MQDFTIHFNHMIEVMRRVHNISPSCAIHIKKFCELIHYDAGQILLRFKETQPCAWFQVSGLTAEFTWDRNVTRDMVTWLWHPDDFLFSVPGFFSQEPAGASIKALTNCSFIYITHRDLGKVTRKSKDGLLLNEKLRSLESKLRKQHFMDIGLSASKRVKMFYQKHPEVFKNCTKVELASFLKMSPDTLNRVVKMYSIEEIEVL